MCIRDRAGPVEPSYVVRILAVGDRVQPVRRDDLVADAGEQLVLAVEAAVGSVGDVAGVLALVGLDLHNGHPDEPSHLVRAGALVRGEAGGDPEDAHDLIPAEQPCREGQQHRRIHPAGVGDAQPPDAGQLPADGPLGLVPVSYTHLDVYKRQQSLRAIARREL